MKYLLLVAVMTMGIVVFAINYIGCSTRNSDNQNGVVYCESWRFGMKINNQYLREIRRKTLNNLIFITKQKADKCDEIKEVKLSRSFLDNYSLVISCKNKFRLRTNLQNNYVYIKFDESFNENSFLWDDSFISWWMMNTDSKLAESTLDFWYDLQIEKDKNKGLIPREVTSNLNSFWSENDRRISNPMIMGRVELELFRISKDKKRLSRVLPKLVNYYNWVENNRKVENNGTERYLWSGWGSGMDNSPRCDIDPDCGYVDLIGQQLALANDILKIATAVGQNDAVSLFSQYQKRLTTQINTYYLDKDDGFVYDVDSKGQRIKYTQSVAFIWSLYAKAFNKDVADRIVKSYLLNDHKFGGFPWLPSVARDGSSFQSEGVYWSGGIWPPMVWIGYLALKDNGYEIEAQKIAERYLEAFEKTWNTNKTLYEYYKPNLENGNLVPGNHPEAKSEFFGWGVIPIGLYFEKKGL